MAAAARVGAPPVPPREESDAGAGRDKLDPITCSSRWLFVNFSVEIDHVTEMLVLRSSCLQVTSIQAVYFLDLLQGNIDGHASISSKKEKEDHAYQKFNR